MPLHFELVTPERLLRSEDVYMVGGIDDAIEKGKRLAAEAA